jgi:hypothetical protein
MVTSVGDSTARLLVRDTHAIHSGQGSSDLGV